MEQELEQEALFYIEGPDEDGCIWIYGASLDDPWAQNLGPCGKVAELMSQWLGSIDYDEHGGRIALRPWRQELNAKRSECMGGEPEDESVHFYVCKACGQAVDKRRLGDVFHHEEAGHEQIPPDA